MVTMQVLQYTDSASDTERWLPCSFSSTQTRQATQNDDYHVGSPGHRLGKLHRTMVTMQVLQDTDSASYTERWLPCSFSSTQTRQATQNDGYHVASPVHRLGKLHRTMVTMQVLQYTDSASDTERWLPCRFSSTQTRQATQNDGYHVGSPVHRLGKLHRTMVTMQVLQDTDSASYTERWLPCSSRTQTRQATQNDGYHVGSLGHRLGTHRTMVTMQVLQYTDSASYTERWLPCRFSSTQTRQATQNDGYHVASPVHSLGKLHRTMVTMQVLQDTDSASITERWLPCRFSRTQTRQATQNDGYHVASPVHRLGKLHRTMVTMQLLQYTDSASYTERWLPCRFSSTQTRQATQNDGYHVGSPVHRLGKRHRTMVTMQVLQYTDSASYTERWLPCRFSSIQTRQATQNDGYHVGSPVYRLGKRHRTMVTMQVLQDTDSASDTERWLPCRFSSTQTRQATQNDGYHVGSPGHRLGKRHRTMVTMQLLQYTDSASYTERWLPCRFSRTQTPQASQNDGYHVGCLGHRLGKLHRTMVTMQVLQDTDSASDTERWLPCRFSRTQTRQATQNDGYHVGSLGHRLGKLHRTMVTMQVLQYTDSASYTERWLPCRFSRTQTRQATQNDGYHVGSSVHRLGKLHRTMVTMQVLQDTDSASYTERWLPCRFSRTQTRQATQNDGYHVGSLGHRLGKLHRTMVTMQVLQDTDSASYTERWLPCRFSRTQTRQATQNDGYHVGSLGHRLGKLHRTMVTMQVLQDTDSASYTERWLPCRFFSTQTRQATQNDGYHVGSPGHRLGKLHTTMVTMQVLQDTDSASYTERWLPCRFSRTQTRPVTHRTMVTMQVLQDTDSGPLLKLCSIHDSRLHTVFGVENTRQVPAISRTVLTTRTVLTQLALDLPCPKWGRTVFFKSFGFVF